MFDQNQNSGTPPQYLGFPFGKADTGTQAPPSFPPPPQAPSGRRSDVERSEIDKNNALKLVYRILSVVIAILGALIAGGVLLGFYTMSSSIASSLGALNSDVKGVKEEVKQVREESNRDIDRLEKDIDNIRQTTNLPPKS